MKDVARLIGKTVRVCVMLGVRGGGGGECGCEARSAVRCKVS